MADSTNATPASEEAGPASRALRAAAASRVTATSKAYTAFITHTAGCDDCRTVGVDCEDAAMLRQAYRDARTH